MSDVQQQIIHAHEHRIEVLLAEIERLQIIADTERERCAKVVETYFSSDDDFGAAIAAAIRRGEP